MENSTRYSLARISLRWMVRECFKTKTGIMFDSQRLRLLGPRPNHAPSLRHTTATSAFCRCCHGDTIRTPKTAAKGKARIRHSPSDVAHRSPRTKLMQARLLEEYRPIGTEEEEELRDALSPIYDQLKRSRSWWILEVIPMEFRHQKGDDKWVSWFGYVELLFLFGVAATGLNVFQTEPCSSSDHSQAIKWSESPS